jgi:hypothetical protein
VTGREVWTGHWPQKSTFRCVDFKSCGGEGENTENKCFPSGTGDYWPKCQRGE